MVGDGCVFDALLSVDYPSVSLREPAPLTRGALMNGKEW